MDEQRLFSEMGELKAGVVASNKNMDNLRDDIKTLRIKVDNVIETRVSSTTFKWVITALSSVTLTLFGIAIRVGLRP